jgi:hypothetical protein
MEIERLRDSLIIKDKEAAKRIKNAKTKRIKKIEETNKQIFKYVEPARKARERFKMDLKDIFDLEEDKLRSLSKKMTERRQRLENNYHQRRTASQSQFLKKIQEHKKDEDMEFLSTVYRVENAQKEFDNKNKTYRNRLTQARVEAASMLRNSMSQKMKNKESLFSAKSVRNIEKVRHTFTKIQECRSFKDIKLKEVKNKIQDFNSRKLMSARNAKLEEIERKEEKIKSHFNRLEEKLSTTEENRSHMFSSSVYLKKENREQKSLTIKQNCLYNYRSHEYKISLLSEKFQNPHFSINAKRVIDNDFQSERRYLVK